MYKSDTYYQTMHDCDSDNYCHCPDLCRNKNGVTATDVQYMSLVASRRNTVLVLVLVAEVMSLSKRVP